MEVDLGIELQYMYTANRNAPILLNIKKWISIWCQIQISMSVILHVCIATQ